MMFVSSHSRLDSGRKQRRIRPTLMAEINVTPMVDIMLVLLVIFMVTAPLLVTGMQVDLPKVTAGELKGDEQPLTVTVDARGRVFIQEMLIKVEDLSSHLAVITGQKLDTRIFIRGDRELQYGRVMEVMGAVTAAGFSKVALVVETFPDVTNLSSKSHKGGL